ncbi:MAG: hypothetical protein KIS66_15580 [Fimbriimonadaceae bacterium]|nr:hypothetical protein [Fimbriimonadaceae bacterium]
MVTPYDWQEGIGHRASYVESKLAQGSPVLALSLPEGVLLFTGRRRRPKIHELYDRIAFSAIGQQSDIEAMRVAAVDFCHQEGYRRSEDDVSVQRVVAALSSPLKRAFADFSLAPVVARSLFAEVGANPADDRFFVLDYDGDYAAHSERAFVAADKRADRLESGLREIEGVGVAEARTRLAELWRASIDDAEEPSARELLEDEAVLLSRDSGRINRFLRLEA